MDDPSPEFTVRVTLSETPATQEELLHEIGSRLTDFDPDYASDLSGRTIISLQVHAADLWVAVLLAMGAVTATGYQPEQIEAARSPRVRRR
ncbi:MAG TPA: hypothetical protein VFP89_09120 [Propionibacteriaceae bacterium]|nr:hypothetical protein [Propionibacteriaceae bacterium]